MCVAERALGFIVQVDHNLRRLDREAALPP